ncbi:unnamed protein product [Phytomonas sp. EM1]|nr:unnamed protein product [Phytomonas sp. EM1]|eukprot:CCW61515.1 unnamed protein product [Phytomonas sp. isolate EM1]
MMVRAGIRTTTGDTPKDVDPCTGSKAVYSSQAGSHSRGIVHTVYRNPADYEALRKTPPPQAAQAAKFVCGVNWGEEVPSATTAPILS